MCIRDRIQGLTIPEEQRLLALMHNKLGAQVEILHRMLPYLSLIHIYGKSDRYSPLTAGT